MPSHYSVCGFKSCNRDTRNPIMYFCVCCKKSSASPEDRVTDPLLAQCWSSVYDTGPTLNQQWVYVSCLLDQKISVLAYHLVNIRLTPVLPGNVSRILPWLHIDLTWNQHSHLILHNIKCTIITPDYMYYNLYVA